MASLVGQDAVLGASNTEAADAEPRLSRSPWCAWTREQDADRLQSVQTSWRSGR
jgi:hypothetical protein